MSLGFIVRAYECRYIELCKNLHKYKGSTVYGFRKQILQQIASIEAAKLLMRVMVSSDWERRNSSVAAWIEAQPEAVTFPAEAEEAKAASTRQYAYAYLTASFEIERSMAPYIASLRLIHSGLKKVLQELD